MRQIIVLLFVVLLTGCAVKPKPDAGDIAANKTLPEQWSIEGRVALKTPEDKFSATMLWQQKREDYQLRLSKLIGGTLLLLESQNASVALQFDGNTYQDYNAERLLWRVTGWTLPMDDFKYWVAGLLNPKSPPPDNLKRDETSRVWSFTSADNWQVEYKDYKVYSGRAMPQNLTIKKEGIELKLRVSDWQFGS